MDGVRQVDGHLEIGATATPAQLGTAGLPAAAGPGGRPAGRARGAQHGHDRRQSVRGPALRRPRGPAARAGRAGPPGGRRRHTHRADRGVPGRARRDPRRWAGTGHRAAGAATAWPDRLPEARATGRGVAVGGHRRGPPGARRRTTPAPRRGSPWVPPVPMRCGRTGPRRRSSATSSAPSRSRRPRLRRWRSAIRPPMRWPPRGTGARWSACTCAAPWKPWSPSEHTGRLTASRMQSPGTPRHAGTHHARTHRGPACGCAR